jgi:transposase
MLKRSYTARALSMEAIAEKIGLSKGFSRTLLKKLTKDGSFAQTQNELNITLPGRRFRILCI